MRFRIAASMIKEAMHPNCALRLNRIPTWAMVADALTKTMEAGALLCLRGPQTDLRHATAARRHARL
eukprot:922101-Pyramimonas_sp.AAC.1